MTAEPSTWNRIAAERRQRTRLLGGLSRAAGIAAGSIFLFAAAVGSYWGILQYEGNFHSVVAGQLYRSAQPDADELQEAVHQYGIRSVLNLRGPHRGVGWYEEEVGASQRLGLTHYDYGLSSKRVLTPQQIHELLDLVRAAPKPLLIHCQSGADRTGLLSALYRYSEAGATAEEADGELTLIYGHFPYLTSRSVAMDQSFWAYVHGQEKPRAQ
jgi:protein tyrosine/serine phosphatase